MPHLHDEEKTDNDDVSHVSACSKSVDSGSEAVCPVAESAANKLLSLAAMAEEHAKSNAEPQTKAEAMKPRQVESHPPFPSVAQPVSRPPPSFVDDSRQLPPPSPGMSPRWGVMSHHSPRFHGFVRQGVMHRVYPGPISPSPGVSPMAEHPVRYIRRGGGRGGFPMWTSSPRPPYRPLVHGGSPSPPPHAFRSPVAQPYMTRQCSSNDDDISVNSGRGPALKRPAGYPPKSILKKPRVETPPTASSSEASASPNDEAATKKIPGESAAYTLSKTVSASTDTGDNTEAQTKTTIKSVVVEKSSFSSEDTAVKRQRIISPASSNEYPKSDHEEELGYAREGSLSPDQRRRMMNHEAGAGSPGPHYHLAPPFRMGRPHPSVQGMHCGPRRPYMPPAPMYPHHSMRPFPPPAMPAVTGPGMFPPRSISSRGRAGLVAMPPFYARGRMDASPSPPSMSAGQPRPQRVLDKSHQPPVSSSPVAGAGTRRLSGTPASVGSLDALGDVPGNANRCIPLKPPVPSKYWSDADMNKDVILPDFHRLVNFPDLLVKGRGASSDTGTESGTPNALSGKKRCVMCGQLRVSATYVRAKKANAEQAGEVSGSTSGVSNNGSSHIIPRQNKGVCTACDVTVWVALELDGLEIKWCKGCKNFRPWSHFGDKSLATKCLRCRDRQKEKYALQKSASRRRSSTSAAEEEKKTGDEHDTHHCSLALVAANGLRNLMNAR